MGVFHWKGKGLVGLVLGAVLLLAGCELSQESNLFQFANKKAVGPSTPSGPSGAVQSISVSPSTINYLLGGPVQHLTVAFVPVNAVNRTVTWAVQSGSKLVVTSTGPSTADLSVAAGTVVTDLAGQVTATSQDGGKTSFTSVTFTSSSVAVTGVGLPSAMSLASGQSQIPALTVDPPSATNKNVTWNSSDPTVATVDSTGNVTALKKGSTTITATAADGSGAVSNACVVTVTQPIAAITLPATFSVPLGTTASPVVTIMPLDANDKSLTWKSSNLSVATVDASGMVTAQSLGTTILTAQAADGSGVVSGDCLVTVVQPVTGIVLPSALPIPIGQTSALTAVVSPANASAKAVTWSSSNTVVATVDPSGVVTAKQAGTSTITAQATDGSGVVSGDCLVTVVQPVTGIVLPSALPIPIGQTSALTAVVNPANASAKTVTWSSSNTVVATVDPNGVVTAKQAGASTITAQATDGSGVVSNGCVVSVVQPVTGVVLTTSIIVSVGATSTVTATVTPASASLKALAWTSSNTAVATVDSLGVVTAKQAGTATITATAKDGSGVTSNACSVTVVQPVTQITMLTTKYLTVGFTFDLMPTVTVYPTNATNQGFTWGSSNVNVVTVSSLGVISAMARGLATITATATDGSGVFATCDVDVSQLVQGITLPATLSLPVGQASRLNAVIVPSNASNPTLNWGRDNITGMVTVDGDGTVHGIAKGTARVYANTTDNSGVISNWCDVTVVPVVESVTVDQTILSLLVGESSTLSATVTPADASNSAVTWSSANPAVVTVDPVTGRVTGVTTGSALITATAGGFTSQMTVQVTSPLVPTLGTFPATGSTAYTGAVIAIDPYYKMPVVAYVDSLDRGQYVRWDGGFWASYGTFATLVNLGTADDRSINISAVVDGSGVPAVAYLDAAKVSHVVQYQGLGGWVPLDSWVVNNTVSGYLSLGIGRYVSINNSTQLNNALFLGLSNDAYNPAVYRTGVAVYDNTFSPPAWVAPVIQNYNFTLVSAKWISLATNQKYNYGPARDYFYVASAVMSSPPELWVQDVGGPYNGPIAKASVDAAYVTLALDNQNLPWVCYQDVTTNQVVLAKKIGTSLTTVTTMGTGTGDHPAFIMDNQASGSVAYVAFRDTAHGGRVALWKYENGVTSVVSDDVSGGVSVTNVTLAGGYPSSHLYVMYEASGVITVKDFAR